MLAFDRAGDGPLLVLLHGTNTTRRIWAPGGAGARRVARARTSRHTSELPPHAVVEEWPGCGHAVMWDDPVRFIAAALALPA